MANEGCACAEENIATCSRKGERPLTQNAHRCADWSPQTASEKPGANCRNRAETARALNFFTWRRISKAVVKELIAENAIHASPIISSRSNSQLWVLEDD